MVSIILVVEDPRFIACRDNKPVCRGKVWFYCRNLRDDRGLNHNFHGMEPWRPQGGIKKVTKISDMTDPPSESLSTTARKGAI